MKRKVISRADLSQHLDEVRVVCWQCHDEARDAYFAMKRAADTMEKSLLDFCNKHFKESVVIPFVGDDDTYAINERYGELAIDAINAVKVNFVGGKAFNIICETDNGEDVMTHYSYYDIIAILQRCADALMTICKDGGDE